MRLDCRHFGFLLRASIPAVLFTVTTCGAEDWPICDNREFRDDETEPGGLKLLGVKESPLGFFPQTHAALTHEHFFQQLREVLTDDCPRIFVEVGVQPAPGLLQNWSSTSLWLRYFNHSGIVLAMDPVIDFLDHHAESLKKEPWSSMFGKNLQVKHLHASLGTKDNAEEQVVPQDGDSAQVKLLCESGVGVESPSHACYQVRRRPSWPTVEYRAPTLTFDTVWKQHLGGKHVDFLHVGSNLAHMLEEGFARVVSARAFTVLAFRVGKSWTKMDLERVVAYLDKYEYFSMFRLVCKDSSQAGSFSYHGPGGVKTGPTTYLPLSSMDLIHVIDWEKMPLPQDVISLDLRQPEVFKTIQLGDVQCDAEESGACAADDDQCRAEAISKPPERPQLVRVTKSGARSITLEWRPHPDGPTPDSYLLRLDPGAVEETLDHDTFDALSSVQSYTMNGLRPDVEYTISLRALGIGGESSKVTLSHRTQREEVPSIDSPYDVMEGVHCGMGAAEEVQPAGPSPSGASYFPGLGDVDACRSRCEGNRQCVAFQVNAGNACWLYRRKPQRRTAGGSEPGWWCAVRKE